jgi:hypothetical protein
VPQLQIPVYPFPRITPLDAPESLGRSCQERFEFAFNFADILVQNANEVGAFFPRDSAATPTSANWEAMQLFCYNATKDVSSKGQVGEYR